jgi:hypothetical protein
MKLEEAKNLIEKIEEELKRETYVVLHTYERNDKKLHLALTERLKKKAKKARVWKTSAFLTALKNAEYGFDPDKARSVGGADGIFLLDRNYVPKNEMMRKLFDRFLDKPDSGVSSIAEKLGTTIDNLLPVRLVSHHLRLLGFLYPSSTGDWLVLVDFDDTK